MLWSQLKAQKNKKETWGPESLKTLCYLIFLAKDFISSRVTSKIPRGKSHRKIPFDLIKVALPEASTTWIAKTPTISEAELFFILLPLSVGFLLFFGADGCQKTTGMSCKLELLYHDIWTCMFSGWFIQYAFAMVTNSFGQEVLLHPPSILPSFWRPSKHPQSRGLN